MFPFPSLKNEEKIEIKGKRQCTKLRKELKGGNGKEENINITKSSPTNDYQLRN